MTQGLAETDKRAPPMLAPCGLTLTRPGATAIRAGAMFRPCGDTLTPVGLTEIRVCTHTLSCLAYSDYQPQICRKEAG